MLHRLRLALKTGALGTKLGGTESGLTPYAYRHPDSLLTLVQRYLANAKGLDASHHDQTAG